MLGIHAVAALLLTPPLAGAMGAMRQDTACHAYLPRGLRTGPTFTPYTRAPELKDREQVRSALEAHYPAELKARGVSGETLVWALVDRCGAVAEASVRQSSGEVRFDSAAVSIARLMRFQPALRGEWPVDVWIQLPIRFGEAPYPVAPFVPPSSTWPPVRAAEMLPANARSDVLPRLDAPEGYVGPSLLNAGQVRDWLSAGYAALGGRGGDSVRIALHIDQQGIVTDARLAVSSGRAPVDSLALAVARWAVFTPAVDPYRRYTSLWTTLPLRFPPPAQP